MLPVSCDPFHCHLTGCTTSLRTQVLGASIAKKTGKGLWCWGLDKESTQEMSIYGHLTYSKEADVEGKEVVAQWERGNAGHKEK